MIEGLSLGLLATLALLALVDSTSTGTLILPVWLLLAPGRIRPGRYLGYLVVVAGAYLVLGLALALGARALIVSMVEDLSVPDGWATPLAVGQVVVGAALLAWSQVLARRAKAGVPGTVARVLRWRDRVMSGEAGVGALVTVGLTAVAIEAAMMLPYLGAIGALTAADPPLPALVLTMAGYCLVMILPAVLLLGVRLGLGRRIEPTLQRFGDWLQRVVADSASWIVGIAGVLIGLSGLQALTG